MSDSSLVTVATYTDAVQAHLARGRLNAEGVPATLAHEHHIWANWALSNALGGVKVQVPRAFRAQALEILDQLARGDYELSDTAGDEARCPRCGSTHIEESTTAWRLAFLGLFLLQVPVPFRRGRYVCKSCAHDWTREL